MSWGKYTLKYDGTLIFFVPNSIWNLKSYDPFQKPYQTVQSYQTGRQENTQSFPFSLLLYLLHVLYACRALKRKGVPETKNNFIITNNPHLYFPTEEIVKTFNSGEIRRTDQLKKMPHQ